MIFIQAKCVFLTTSNVELRTSNLVLLLELRTSNLVLLPELRTSNLSSFLN